MRVLTMCRGAVVAGIAAALAVGPVGAGLAAPMVAPAAIAQVRSHIVAVRVRVPRGILSGVPTGGDPYWRSRPQPYAVLSPLAAPVIFAPVVVAPILAPILAPVDELAPIDFGPCFVPTEHTGQLGYWGSCPESYFRQYTNRPD